MCPAIDFTTFGHTGTIMERLLVKFLFRNLRRDVLGSNKVSAEAAKLSNPTTFIENGMAPIYLQQGTRDPAVPFTQVKEFSEKLARILPAKDLVFHVLEGAPHAGADKSFFLPENVDPILRFFERHMSR